MPRATWKGFLRLSLVSCPIYLQPATTRTKSIRLNQVWVPHAPRPELHFAEVGDDDEAPGAAERFEERGRPLARSADRGEEPAPYEPVGATERIALQPVRRETGETVERREVLKGYEYERGQFITFTPGELKAIDVESTHTIDLAAFVPRAEVDPVYFNVPYYVYPDGKLAAEAFSVIGTAMKAAGIAGLGRVTIARRERMVLVEPRHGGMLLITLRG